MLIEVSGHGTMNVGSYATSMAEIHRMPTTAALIRELTRRLEAAEAERLTAEQVEACAVACWSFNNERKHKTDLFPRTSSQDVADALRPIYDKWLASQQPVYPPVEGKISIMYHDRLGNMRLKMQDDPSIDSYPLTDEAQQDAWFAFRHLPCVRLHRNAAGLVERVEVIQ